MISWAAHRPALVLATCGALVLAGAVALTRLPVATKPYVELPRLTVAMNWPGASAELVATYLGSPIESAVQAVRGVKRIGSESGEGYVQLDIQLERGANIQMTRLAILERLEVLRSEFPPGASGLEVSNYVPEGLGEEPLQRYSVYGPYTAGTLQELVDRQLKPRLSAVEGVAGVAVHGGAQVGIAVAYRPERLRELGIASATLLQALDRARAVQSLGVERLGATERRVVLRDVPGALTDLGDLPVQGVGGRVYPISTLATIRREEDNQGRFFRMNGEPAVMMQIARLPGADAIKTAARVRAALAELQPTLPAGVRFLVVGDESVRLGAQLGDLGSRGSLAFLAVLIVLAITLQAPRAVMLVMMSAAISIAGTTLGLYLLDVPANLLTLAGLGMGIGILVQNGLVVVDRFRTVPDTPRGRAEAGRRITPAVLGSTLTTAVVLIPFVYLQGDTRAAFTSFAVAFALALGCSILSSVVMLPAIGGGHGMHMVRWPHVRHAYLRTLIFLMRWRWATIVGTLLMLTGLGWVFAVKVPRSSFSGWWRQRTTLSGRVDFPSGSDPVSVDLSVRELERIVLGRPGVEMVQAQSGPGGGFVQVIFDDRSARSVLPYQLQDELSQHAALIGGASVMVQGYGPGFASGGSVGSLQGFRIKILGYSFAGVEQLALDLKVRLQHIPRVHSVDINAAGFWFADEWSRDITLMPDRAALAGYRLSSRDFASSVTREVAGAAGRQRVTVGDDELRLSLKAAGAQVRTLDELREALVPNALNAPVRIGDLAHLDEREALSRISREDQQYVRILSYDFRGPVKLANRTHEAFMRSISVPAGYTVSDEHFGWEDDQSQKGLWLVFGVGLALVALTVAMVFNSAWGAAMVYLSLPIALGGVVAAFWLTSTAFTREAAVGVILVIGLAVNHAILLVDGILARPGRGARAVVAACRDRVGMISLVALTTLASPLPLTVGTGADDMFRAIALALVGGTVAGTIGALLLLPPILVRRPRPGDPS
jgi:HAE1 family hydrophobic/amphiphilic exporter-1